MFGDHRDALRGQPEEGGQGGAYESGPLAGVVHGEGAGGGVPVGGGGMWLHRVVVQRRYGVRAVHAHRRCGERGGCVARLAVGRIAAVDLLGGVGGRVAGVQHGVVGLGVVVDADGRGRGPGGLRGLGHGQGHVPAAVGYFGVLEHAEGGVVAGAQPGGVVGREDVEDAGQRERAGGVDGGDASAGHGGGHRPCVRPVRQGVLRRITGLSRDLLPALQAGGGTAEGGRRGGGAGVHGGSSRSGAGRRDVFRNGSRGRGDSRKGS